MYTYVAHELAGDVYTACVGSKSTACTAASVVTIKRMHLLQAIMSLSIIKVPYKSFQN